MNGSGRPGILRRVPPAAWFFSLLGAARGLEGWKALSLGVSPFDVQFAAALALFAGAGAFAAWAIFLFRAKKTTVVPFATASTLVTSGPFRLSRNPLYVSLVTTLAAFGVLLDSAWYLLLAALLAVVLDRFVIRDEERRLGELFGKAYAEYRARVRRWL